MTAGTAAETSVGRGEVGRSGVVITRRFDVGPAMTRRVCHERAAVIGGQVSGPRLDRLDEVAAVTSQVADVSDRQREEAWIAAASDRHRRIGVRCNGRP